MSSTTQPQGALGESVETSSSSVRHSRPGSISLPPPPPLDRDEPAADFDTNTLALVLPHQALFAPEALHLLRDAFSGYGPLAHWAPVRGFGRVIIVYERDEDALLAKTHGDWFRLDVDLDADDDDHEAAQKPVDATTQPGEGYFGHSRKPSRTSKGIVLRVYALPRTDLSGADNHLRPPEVERNFLISPPGSPPEGWEPIVEEGPNAAPLADDLRRALEALQLSGRGRGPEVILDEGGVRVEVEDTSHDDVPEWGEEEVQTGGPNIWVAPSQDNGMPTSGFGGLGGSAFPKATIASMMPTARPPPPA